MWSQNPYVGLLSHSHYMAGAKTIIDVMTKFDLLMLYLFKLVKFCMVEKPSFAPQISMCCLLIVSINNLILLPDF